MPPFSHLPDLLPSSELCLFCIFATWTLFLVVHVSSSTTVETHTTPVILIAFRKPWQITTHAFITEKAFLMPSENIISWLMALVEKYEFSLTQGSVWCILWSRKTKWAVSCHTSAVWTWWTGASPPAHSHYPGRHDESQSCIQEPTNVSLSFHKEMFSNNRII